MLFISLSNNRLIDTQRPKSLRNEFRLEIVQEQKRDSNTCFWYTVFESPYLSRQCLSLLEKPLSSALCNMRKKTCVLLRQFTSNFFYCFWYRFAKMRRSIPPLTFSTLMLLDVRSCKLCLLSFLVVFSQ